MSTGDVGHALIMFGIVRLKRRNRCYTDTLLDERKLRVGFDLQETCCEMSHCLGRHEVQTWFWCRIWSSERLSKSKWAPSWTAILCSQAMAQIWWNPHLKLSSVVQSAPSKMRKKVDSRVRTLARDSVSTDPNLKDWTPKLCLSWKKPWKIVHFGTSFRVMANAMSHGKWERNGRFFFLQSFIVLIIYDLSCKHRQEVYILLLAIDLWGVAYSSKCQSQRALWCDGENTGSVGMVKIC